MKKATLQKINISCDDRKFKYKRNNKINFPKINITNTSNYKKQL